MPDGMPQEDLRYTALTDRPIPKDLPSVIGWKELPIQEIGEPLVSLGPFSENDAIFTNSIYAAERNDSPYSRNTPEGSLVTMFVRKGVAEDLKRAQSLLPDGMYLVVFDSYRTVDVQRALFNQYFEPLKEQHPDWTEEQLLTETQKYVSLPSQDAARPSPHNTGGSVDLAIFRLPEQVNQKLKEINQQIAQLGDNWQEIYKLEMKKIALIGEHAQLLNFGTPFDWGGKEAALNYLENKDSLSVEEQEARKNRRLLYNIMTEAGFEPYEDEWWHYNSKKSQMGAKTADLDQAEYGAATLSDENQTHEKMRKDHRLGSIRILEGARLIGKVNVLEEAFRVVQQSLSESGDPRTSSLPESAKIAPVK